LRAIIDGTPATAARLAKVVVRPRPGTCELHIRIRMALPRISFESDDQKGQFQRVVQTASHFEQLPQWCRDLVLTAEAF
jgi:hypothetical protein